jgi:hypothetical protein
LTRFEAAAVLALTRKLDAGLRNRPDPHPVAHSELVTASSGIRP